MREKYFRQRILEKRRESLRFQTSVLRRIVVLARNGDADVEFAWDGDGSDDEICFRWAECDGDSWRRCQADELKFREFLQLGRGAGPRAQMQGALQGDD